MGPGRLPAGPERFTRGVWAACEKVWHELADCAGQLPPRVAIFVSKYDHCLVDLLYRQRNGELACEFPLMISNHPHAQRHADFYGIPYYMFPVTRETKPQVEEQE